MNSHISQYSTEPEARYESSKRKLESVSPVRKSSHQPATPAAQNGTTNMVCVFIPVVTGYKPKPVKLTSA